MNLLILGGNGMLGPWVVRALKNKHNILLTDINDPHPNYKGEFLKLSVDDTQGVINASKNMDMIINLSVLRPDRKLAFDVNTMGNYSMMMAAKENKIKRVINTGPHYQLAGPQYEEWDHNLNPDMPPASGTRLYAHTKALGQEVCRLFSNYYDIQVLTLLYYNMKHHWDLSGPEASNTVYHNDMTPYTTSWIDCGTAIKSAVEVSDDKLPSNCETFFVLPDIPHGKFNNQKIRNILDWKPKYHNEGLWNKKWRNPPDRLTEAF